MLEPIAIITAILWAAAASCYHTSQGKSASNFISFILGGAFFSFFIGAVPLAQCFALLVIGYVCFLAHARLRTFMLASSLGLGVVLLLFGALGPIEWSALQEKYPFESMADRLAYETKDRARAEVQPTDEIKSAEIESGFSPEVVDSLDLEISRSPESLDLDQRAKALSLIHASFVTQFTNSPGFGVERGINIATAEQVLSRSTSLRLLAGKWQSQVAMNDGTTAISVSNGQPSRPVDSFLIPQLQSVHRNTHLDFVNLIGFGYVRDREHVVGFQSHRMTHMPSQFRAGSELMAETKQGTWGARRVELVSLLKFDEPRVYRSKNLPQMDELRSAETRKLDDFEQESLAALSDGALIQARDFGNHVRMLGAVRAASQCTACHTVEHGALLGAFSYEFGFRQTDTKVVSTAVGK